MLAVCCVNWGNYQGCGVQYVNTLHAAARKFIPAPFRFLCFTDDETGAYDPGVETRPLPGTAAGWWNKLYLFAKGAIPEGDRVLFFDLDTLITAPIPDLAAYDGPFAALRPFRGGGGHISSGVMAWPAGWGTHLWETWVSAGRPHSSGGDDSWINIHAPRAANLNRLYTGVVSYRFHCKHGLPGDARIVCFSRQPKPHNCGTPWVAEHWPERTHDDSRHASA